MNVATSGPSSTESPTETTSRNTSKLSLRITILTAFVFLLVVCVLSIMVANHFQNRRAVLSQAERLLDQATRTVIAKVGHYLSPAANLVQMTSRLCDQGTFSLDSPEELEPLTIEVLRSYPQLTMYNVADKHGNFLMPKEFPDGHIDTKFIRRTDNPPSVTWKCRDRSGNVVNVATSTQLEHVEQYDPRGRPWYKGARDADGIFWTDIYVLFTDQKPGVIASYPIRSADGELEGVVGLDIELGQLSEFLQQLELGNGIALIVNDSNTLVAFPDASRVVKPSDEPPPSKPAIAPFDPCPAGVGGKPLERLKAVQVEELGIDAVSAAFRQRKIGKVDQFSFESRGQKFLASFTRLPQEVGAPWTVVLIVPEDDFVGYLKRANQTSAIIGIVILCFAVLCARVLSNGISQPIIILAGQIKRLKDFQLDQPVGVKSRIHEIQSMSDAISTMQTGLRAFNKYVPATLVRELIHTGEEARIGGQPRQLTIMFTDIADFTTISEAIGSEDLFVQLSEYFDRLTQAIQKHSGTVDKFIGDSIMAFWGAPHHNDRQAIDACRAALMCRDVSEELNRQWLEQGKPAFQTRIGLHSGEAIVGNVGSNERMNYTAMGDSTNLASRLEGANKVYGTQILVSDATFRQVTDEFIFRPVDIVRVKGKQQAIGVHELLGDQKRTDKDVVDRCARFVVAFEAYRVQDWKKAASVYEELLASCPDDSLAQIYVQRCRLHAAAPPGPNWDGVFELETK
jgi:adenylate cyclase